MNSELSDKLVGLIFVVSVALVIGYAGMRSVLKSFGNLKKQRHPRIYNYAGIIIGGVLGICILIGLMMFVFLWFKNL